MIAKELTAEGLTAKHAAELVKAANTFKADVWIESDNKKVNAKSLMGVISLGLKTARKIKILCDGADETAAAAALQKFFAGVK
jgi:phosphotransferase system HPr (HPr) family protein